MAHKIRIGTKKEPKLSRIEQMSEYKKSSLSSLLWVFIIIIIVRVGLASLGNYSPEDSTTPQSSPQPSSNIHYVEFEVNYSGQWSGSIMVGSEYSSFDSSGYQRIGLNLTEGTYYSFSAQKMEGGYEKLELRLYSDGNQVKYAFTNSEYGIASVYWTVE